MQKKKTSSFDDDVVPFDPINNLRKNIERIITIRKISSWYRYDVKSGDYDSVRSGRFEICRFGMYRKERIGRKTERLKIVDCNWTGDKQLWGSKERC